MGEKADEKKPKYSFFLLGLVKKKHFNIQESKKRYCLQDISEEWRFFATYSSQERAFTTFQAIFWRVPCLHYWKPISVMTSDSWQLCKLELKKWRLQFIVSIQSFGLQFANMVELMLVIFLTIEVFEVKLVCQYRRPVAILELLTLVYRGSIHTSHPAALFSNLSSAKVL